ncbi:Uncharacterised protein [uncultured Comamonas sp.]|nr:Uncharacterised protein [uncultured Comamonas sp.]
MKNHPIAFFFDFLNPQDHISEGLLDIIYAPLHIGLGLKHPIFTPKNLLINLDEFNPTQFKNIIKNETSLQDDFDIWRMTYHEMPPKASEYFFSFLHDRFLISAGTPPWLLKGLKTRDIGFMDISLSPIEFPRDRLIAIYTNREKIKQKIIKHSVTDEEIRLEASLLGANLRMHRKKFETELRLKFDVTESLIIDYQYPGSKELTLPTGNIACLTDFSKNILEIAAERKIFLLRDTSREYENNFFAKERKKIEAALKQSIQYCPQNKYQLLASHDDFEFFSINAASHQEAFYFNKKSHTLRKRSVDVIGMTGSDHHYQFYLEDIIAPSFWNEIFGIEDIPKIHSIRNISRNYARDMMNQWGDFERVVNWERTQPAMAYLRSGGIVVNHRLSALNERIGKLENALQNNTPTNSSGNSPIQKIKDSKLGQKAFIFGNSASILDLDLNTLMQMDTFWCNNAYRMDELKIPFNPKYYFLSDVIGIHKAGNRILDLNFEIGFFSRVVKKEIENQRPDFSKETIIYPDNSIKFFENPANDIKINPSLYLLDGGTTTFVMIQYAYWMGYKEVYLAGVDLDYTIPYFYGEFNPVRNTAGEYLSESMKISITTAQKIFEKEGRTLGKITQSPNLPLEFFKIEDVI